MDGQDADKFPISFLNRQGKLIEALVTTNKRCNADGAITGIFCFLHIASLELQQVFFSGDEHLSPPEHSIEILKTVWLKNINDFGDSLTIYLDLLCDLQALQVQQATEKVAIAKLKELAYIRQEIKNPLYGITFTRNLLEDTNLTEDQRQFLETSEVCELQLRKILNDMDLESIEDG